MNEIPEVIQQLHARYKKLLPLHHKWKKHRTLVIRIKGFHHVVVDFSSPKLLVGFKWRDRGSTEQTSKTQFKGDDLELFRRIVSYIECAVAESEWEQAWPPPKEDLDPDDQKIVEDLLKNWSETDVDDEPFNGGA